MSVSEPYTTLESAMQGVVGWWFRLAATEFAFLLEHGFHVDNVVEDVRGCGFKYVNSRIAIELAYDPSIQWLSAEVQSGAWINRERKIESLEGALSRKIPDQEWSAPQRALTKDEVVRFVRLWALGVRKLYEVGQDVVPE